MSDNFTLYTSAAYNAKKHKNKTAIKFYGKKISFSKLLRLIDSFAVGLHGLGIKARDVVTLCLPNTPSAVIAFYAVNKIGAIANLIHPYSTPSTLKKNMSEVGSKTLIAYDIFIAKNEKELSNEITIICSRGDEFMGSLGKIYYRSTQKTKIDCLKAIAFKDMLKRNNVAIEPYQFRDDEPAVFLPSGGTTGEPKIIMHNCRVLNELAGLAQFFLSDDISEYRAMYSVLPIFHGYGLCMNMHLCVINGITNVMAIKFDPVHMAKEIKKEKIAVLTGVPTMYYKLLDNKIFQKADLRSIRECFIGGDQAPQTLITDFNKLLKRQGSSGAVYTGYGLTETVTVCAVTSKKYNKPKSIGYPLPNTKIAIIKNNAILNAGEIGEICISTPIIMLGYYNTKQLPIKEVAGTKWLFTGDYGYLDEFGYLFFKQRIKNTIKVNGIPIFPSEIEELVESIKGVKRAVAIGMKDLERGEVVKIIVEPELGADTKMLRKDILNACIKELIVYAQPRKVEFRDKLPINSLGKIDRTKLN